MKINFTEHTIRILIVEIHEAIDAFNAPQLRERLEAYQDDGVTRFVLDLSETPFMDSAGMAVMVSLLKRARLAGGDVKLVSPKLEGAKRILHLTKFDRVFDMADDAQTARGMFTGA
jgi:anti-anti-sigma factor